MATSLTNSELLTVDIQKNIVDARTNTDFYISKLFKIIPTEGKTVKVLKTGESMTQNRAEFYAQGESVVAKDFTFNSVTLTPKRMATAIELSQSFVEETDAENLKAEIEKIMINRIFSGIDSKISNGTLTGEGPKEMQVLIPTANGDSASVRGQAIPFKEMFNYVNDIAQNTSKKNMVILLSTLAPLSVKDENGNEFLSFDNVPEDADATFMGVPVYYKPLPVAHSARNTTNPIAFIVSSRDAYQIAMKNIVIKQVKGDVKAELNNKVTFLAETYVDGKEINHLNKLSLVFAKITAASESEPELVENPTMSAQSIELDEEQPKTKRKSNKKA